LIAGDFQRHFRGVSAVAVLQQFQRWHRDHDQDDDRDDRPRQFQHHIVGELRRRRVDLAVEAQDDDQQQDHDEYSDDPDDPQQQVVEVMDAFGDRRGGLRHAQRAGNGYASGQGGESQRCGGAGNESGQNPETYFFHGLNRLFDGGYTGILI